MNCARPDVVVEAIESRCLLSADLTAGIVRSLPNILPPGATHKLTVRVANIGDAPAKGAASVSIYASSDTAFSGDDVRLGNTIRALRLKPGKSNNIKITVPPPTGLSPGSYTVFALVNTASSAIADANPGNDMGVGPASVTIPQPSVDLVGEFAKLPSAPLQAFTGGRSACTTVRVFNTGNTIAQGQLGVSVYLSADGTFDSSDALLGTSPLKSANIKASAKKDVKVTLQSPPATTPAGRYSLIAMVDPSNAIAEVYETNNTAVSPTQVPVVKTRPPHYDDHDYHYDHGYYWTDGYYDDTFYYYDDGEWYYPDEPVILVDPGYTDYDDSYEYEPSLPPEYDPLPFYFPDDLPPPEPPPPDDWGYTQPPPEPEPYTPPIADTPVDPWNESAGAEDTMPNPWNDNAGSDDVWLEDWGW